MKLKLSLFLVFLLTAGYLSAQTILSKEGFFPGSLHYKNGQVKTAFVSAPKKPGQKSIFIRATNTAKSEKIPSELLDSISFTTSKGFTYCFANLSWSMKEGGRIKNPQWFYTVVKGYASLYMLPGSYVITAKGNAYAVTYSVDSFGSEIYYMIKKQHDKVAYYFGYTSTFGPNRISQLLQRSATHYLSEDQDLVDRITKKYELSDRDAEKIINIYNDYMSQKR
jgi:hypothetical protein